MPADLFSPLALRDTELPNRLMVAPMCQYAVDDRDGIATDWHLVHLGSRAVGGAGLVMTEATAIEPRGRISPQDLGIWSDAHADALAPITAFIASQGAVPGIQFAHAGRKASKTRPWEGSEPLPPDEGGWDVIAPSDRPWPYENDAPCTSRLSQAEIENVVASFRTAAQRADDAGFAVAEIHAAHGYLLHEFLSPVTNDRTDAYGGSFDDRTRLLREVTEAVRAVWPAEKPVFVRLSGTDWLPERDAWTIQQTTALADELAGLGVDLVDISSGGITPDSWPDRVGPGYQLPLAEHVRKETTTDIAVGTVGGITTPEHADEIIRNDRADLGIIGRAFLRNPYFGVDAAQELQETDRLAPAVHYRRAYQ